MATILESNITPPKLRCVLGWGPAAQPCKLEYQHTEHHGTRAFMCKMHQQWVYVFPDSVDLTYHYSDMSTGHLVSRGATVSGWFREKESTDEG